MKRFATELKGKTVMTEDGQILGILTDFMMDTRTGKIETLLVTPAETVETRLFKTDPGGRLILGFKTMRAVKDVIVTEVAEAK
ncbi:MAG: PRC-barrel domain protein [Euryarchaeota archaeon RBG_16_68_12]|nr:MAG: PRC-barrel domain protein [Euryarchaeota archaeon RBG_16_68_12]